MRKIPTLLFVFSCFILNGAENFKKADASTIEIKAESLLSLMNSKYRSELTGQFYYKQPQDIPAPEEIKKLLPLKKSGIPNWHGGGSGMEDCSLFNGTMLSALCDRYEVLKTPEAAEEARRLFNGLKLNATAHGDVGFVARGISPADGKTVYPGTSVDQYTYFVYSLWKYARSPIATSKEKREIAKIFSEIADKMTREVRADADPSYSFKFYKGMPDDRGTGRMIYENPRRVIMRLPMIYAAAWDVSGKKEYLSLYKKYIDEAVEGNAERARNIDNYVKKWFPAYVVPQMMFALDLVWKVETDPAMKEKIRLTFDAVGKAFAENKYTLVTPQRNPRDAAEIINGLLLAPNLKPSDDYINILKNNIMKASGYPGSVYCMLGAYWCARSKGAIKP